MLVEIINKKVNDKIKGNDEFHLLHSTDHKWVYYCDDNNDAIMKLLQDYASNDFKITNKLEF